MIGNIITGLNVNGKECTGRVLDRVTTLQQIQMKVGTDLSRPQVIPMALDAYLVLDEQGRVHLVPPSMISKIETKEQRAIRFPAET